MTGRGRHLRQERSGRRVRGFLGSAAQVALALVAVVVIGLPLATDHKWRTVETGSMRPTLEPGDVILAAPMDRAAETGDMIVFVDPVHGDRDVVHRLVDVDAEGRLVTQGDANSSVDPWTLHPDDVTGVVTLTVPRIGFIVQAMDTKAGILGFLVVPSLMIIGFESRVWYRFIRYGREAFEPVIGGRHVADGSFT